MKSTPEDALYFKFQTGRKMRRFLTLQSGQENKSSLRRTYPQHSYTIFIGVFCKKKN